MRYAVKFDVTKYYVTVGPLLRESLPSSRYYLCIDMPVFDTCRPFFRHGDWPLYIGWASSSYRKRYLDKNLSKKNAPELQREIPPIGTLAHVSYLSRVDGYPKIWWYN